MSRSEPLEPNRPSLGPLFAACAGVWAAALLVEELAWRSYVSSGGGMGALGIPNLPAPLPGGLLAAGAVAVAAALVLLRRRLGARGRRRLACALAPACIGVACSLACASLFWGAWQDDVEALQRALGGEGLEVELAADPVEREYGAVSVAEWHEGARVRSFRVLWPKGTAALSAGHVVRVRGSLAAPGDNAGGRWNHQQGYLGMVSADSVEETGSASGLRGLVSGFRDESSQRIARLGNAGDAAGLLAGVVLGDRTLYAGTELEQDFRTTGLAHLMAVSGTHLAVVTGLLSWVLARTRLPRAARGALVTGCLVLYVALTGFAPSAMRACLMCACAALAGVFGRRVHVVSALSLCVIVFVCWRPSLAFSLAFQLSVLAVFGLVALSPLAALWLRRILPGRFSGLADSVAATLSATLLTLPVTVPAFAQLPLVSPLSTLVAAPLVTLALGLGIPGALVAAFLPPAGELLLDAALAVCGACAALVRALADLPLACVPTASTGPLLGVVFAGISAAFWCWWPLPGEGPAGTGRGRAAPGSRVVRVPRRALAVCAALAFPLALALFDGLGGLATLQRALGPSFTSEAQVVMVDVGQGDCMLVRDRDAAVLIDTGEDGQVLERGLARQGVTHLDAIYLTHKDADHCGALPALTGVVRVDHVFVHEELLDSPAMSRVLEDVRWVTNGRGAEGVGVGDVTRAGRFSLELLGPEHGGESGNDDSLVNLLSYDENGDGNPEARGLLTGDAEAGATAPLAERIGHVDFLKVAHHGSAGGATATELAELSPQIALIGVGADNKYGHPTRETLSLLEQAHARVFRTDLDGDVTLSFSGRRMSVKLQKNG